ncbi:MAG: UvrB/UvrC motif-containing protein [Lachnospiraceae bacterium]
MLCENCNKNEATIHYTEVINGVKNERHLCGECMQEMDGGMEGEFPFSKLIRGMLAAHLNNGEIGVNPTKQIYCPKCQMTYNEFIKLGKFGCAECYGVFGPLITENIKKIQGDTTHKGKKYSRYVEEEQKQIEEVLKEPKENGDPITILQNRLQKSIQVEDYETAAKLRDEIRKIKKDKESSKKNA